MTILHCITPDTISSALNLEKLVYSDPHTLQDPITVINGEKTFINDQPFMGLLCNSENDYWGIGFRSTPHHSTETTYRQLCIGNDTALDSGYGANAKGAFITLGSQDSDCAQLHLGAVKNGVAKEFVMAARNGGECTWDGKPLYIDFSTSNYWVKMCNKIIQWGQSSASAIGSPATVTFPITFSTVDLVVTLPSTGSGNADFACPTVTDVTTSGCKIYTSSGTNYNRQGVGYIAIGK